MEKSVNMQNNSMMNKEKKMPNINGIYKKDKNLSKKIEELAQNFSHVYNIPKETMYNNRRSSKYFSSKEKNHESNSNSSTLKDNITETATIKQKYNRGHKKSLSKTYYIINNNTIVSKVEVLFDKTEKTSTTKVLVQVPSKELNDSFDDVHADDCMENGIIGNDNIELNNELANCNNLDNSGEFTIASENKTLESVHNSLNPSNQLAINDKESKKFEGIYRIIQFYENLSRNFTNFALFLLKYKENFESIEKWFDMTSSFDPTQNKQIQTILMKRYLILEVILFGFIINLYELIRGNSVTGNNSYFVIYNHFKNCLNHSYNLFLYFIKDSFENNDNKENIPATNSSFEELIKEKIKSQEGGKINLEDELGIIERNLHKCTEKFQGIFKDLKDNDKNKNTNNNHNEENGISLENCITSDLRNLDYISSTLKNWGSVKYEDVREMVYNEYLLGNLVKINLLEKETEDEEEIENFKLDEENKENINENQNLIQILNKEEFSFIPPLISSKYEYTLVLDLDETLVHYMEEGDEAYVQVRPYAEFFINELSKYFEIVIFTAATEEYADIVLNELDRYKVISHKLYRRHTQQMNNVYIKDISKLGRDLKKTIIIDNVKDNFSLHQENGLHISDFLGDEKDTELKDLFEDLRNIVVNKNDDVRLCLNNIRSKMLQRYRRQGKVPSQGVKC